MSTDSIRAAGIYLGKINAMEGDGYPPRIQGYRRSAYKVRAEERVQEPPLTRAAIARLVSSL